MNNKRGFIFSISLILIGVCLFFIGLKRSVTIYIYGIPQATNTRALTARGVLRSIGFTPDSQDHIQPGLNHLIGWRSTIAYNPASAITITSLDENINEQIILAERIPANMLAVMGIKLFPYDRVLNNLQVVEPLTPLTPSDSYNIQHIASMQFNVEIDGNSRQISSAAPTIAEALWENDILIDSADRVSPGPGSQIQQNQIVTINRAKPITIIVGENEYNTYSAAPTIAEALAETGSPLQGMDYSIPAEDQPLPANGKIEVFRVREEISLAQETIPYENEYVEDPETELDQQSVVQAGQVGLKVIQTKVRYENEIEVSSIEEAQWTASEPQNRKIGYGTKVVVRTIDTPAGPIEYWRAVNVYATAYSPCRSAADRCYYGTSYGIPVERGVIGVVRSWYNLMAGWPVYVPGYGKGIIADTGGGVPGKYWIDLGFTDEDFEAWHQDVTLYFLTPVPANIPWILP